MSKLEEILLTLAFAIGIAAVVYVFDLLSQQLYRFI